MGSLGDTARRLIRMLITASIQASLVSYYGLAIDDVEGTVVMDESTFDLGVGFLSLDIY